MLRPRYLPQVKAYLWLPCNIGAGDRRHLAELPRLKDRDRRMVMCQTLTPRWRGEL